MHLYAHVQLLMSVYAVFVNEMCIHVVPVYAVFVRVMSIYVMFVHIKLKNTLIGTTKLEIRFFCK